MGRQERELNSGTLGDCASFLISNNNLKDGIPKPSELQKLRQTIFAAVDETYRTDFANFEAHIARLIDTIGIKQPLIEKINPLTKEEANLFLDHLNIGQRDTENGASNFTNMQKVEYLRQGFEKNLSDESLYTLKFLTENNIRAKVHLKPRITSGCHAAAENRDIPDCQELKTIVMKVIADGNEHIVAFNMRGDEELNIAKANEEVKKKFGKTALIKDEVVDIEKLLGLTIGRVNPASLEYAAKNNDIKITQFFSKSLEERVYDHPQEIFTNAAAGTKGISCKLQDLIPVMRDKYGAITGVDISTPTELRELQRPRVYGVIGNNQKEFGTYFEAQLKKQIKKQLATNGSKKYLYPLNSSADGRIEQLFNESEFKYYQEEITEQAKIQANLLQHAHVVIAGHTVGMVRDSLDESWNAKKNGSPIVYITDTTVEHMKDAGISKAVVIASPVLPENWERCGYNQFCSKESVITGKEISKRIEYVNSHTGSPDKMLKQEAENFANFLISTYKGKIDAKHVVIGSQEIERLIRSTQTVEEKIQKELGVKLIYPVECATKKAVNILYADLIEHKKNNLQQTEVVTQEKVLVNGRG